MTKLFALALVFAVHILNAAEKAVTVDDELVASVPYYKRTFHMERDAFLKALGLDPKSILPQPVFFGGPNDQNEGAGRGVLAPDIDDGPRTFPPTFGNSSKVQKALDEFFRTRGVDMGANTSPRTTFTSSTKRDSFMSRGVYSN